MVPRDVSVVGYDGIALSRFTVPPLTTIQQDFPRIGAELVRMVVSQIGKPRPFSVPDVVVPSELVIRGTTAPPPA